MRKRQKKRGIFIRMNRLIRGLHREEGGQTIVLVGLILFSLALFFVLVVNTGHEVAKKFFIQNNADAAALTGASWQARFLNILSLINMVMAIILGIIIILNAIKKALEIATYVLLGIYIALQICCAIPYTAAGCCPGVAVAQSAYQTVNNIYQQYKKIADKIMDALWKVLSVLSDMEDAIVAVSPYVPPIMANVVAYENARAEDPNVSFLSMGTGDTDQLGDFDLNDLGGIGIGSLVVCYPLPPSLPIHEGGLEDVCNEVREFLDEELIDPLKKYGIGYILDPIIDACISVTCEGGDGGYSIENDEISAAGCTPSTNPEPSSPDCQSIYNGSAEDATLNYIEWFVVIRHFQCTTECSCNSGLCANCTTPYSSDRYEDDEYDLRKNQIPPMSGGTLFSGPPPAGQSAGNCGWRKYYKRLDREGDDDGDFKFNEDRIDGVDNDADGLIDEDPIIYLCREETWYLKKCNYALTGNSSPPPGTSENSDKVQPYILDDDWRDNNTTFWFTHFEKGHSPLLPNKFKTKVRSTIGSNAFASSCFFCNTTDESDCDMFHMNWHSKLVPVQEDSSLLGGMPGFLQDVIDVFITH